jgi:hypothetical protein
MSEFIEFVGSDGKNKFLNVAQIHWIEETDNGGALLIGPADHEAVPLSPAAWKNLKARLGLSGPR